MHKQQLISQWNKKRIIKIYLFMSVNYKTLALNVPPWQQDQALFVSSNPLASLLPTRLGLSPPAALVREWRSTLSVSLWWLGKLQFHSSPLMLTSGWHYIIRGPEGLLNGTWLEVQVHGRKNVSLFSRANSGAETHRHITNDRQQHGQDSWCYPADGWRLHVCWPTFKTVCPTRFHS